MLRLKITPREESEIGDPDNEHNEGAKEGQVLVEKDGKFDLRDFGDPAEAFKNWLQKKQEQHFKDKQIEEMKRVEKESGFCLHCREESEKAFRQWLKRKRTEKRAEQQAARERSRRLMLEECRARRMHDLHCTVNEIKPFQFSDHYGYCY
ncbi:hypothetical protein cypCar_00020639 [Cyprinus carpio]|nr:hypothetical protein cypCar_00020639 [Cyprinus carpio]